MESTKKKPATAKESSGNGPIWTTHSHRVKAAMWKHDQKGKARYTVAIFRSYLDEKADEWKNVHFFDTDDLDDVEKVRMEAKTYLSEVIDHVESMHSSDQER